jgi:hypothetical protein
VVVTGGSEAPGGVDALPVFVVSFVASFGVLIDGVGDGVRGGAAVTGGLRLAVFGPPDERMVGEAAAVLDLSGLAVRLSAVEGGPPDGSTLVAGGAPTWNCPVGMRTAHPMTAAVIVTAAATRPPIQ